MNDLKIFNWDWSKRTVRFVGYNREHTACFIRDEQNARRAITLRLPSCWDLHFYRHAIARDGSPPVEINRVALHRPACFVSRQEGEAFENLDSWEALSALAYTSDAWKVETKHKCCLEPTDDEKLMALLQAKVRGLRQQFEVLQKETEDQIAALPPEDTIAAAKLRAELQRQFTTLTPRKDGKLVPISVFDVTLEMVRHGWSGLREEFMEPEWARRFGIELETIAPNAAACRSWIKRNAINAHQRTKDITTGLLTVDYCLRLDPWQWEMLEASVCYEVRFADGTRCWLDGIEERTLSSSEEAEQFSAMEAAQAPRESTPWFSEGFATIRQCNNQGDVVDIVPLSNEFRALCQLLFERPDGFGQLSEIEPRIGTRTHELDIAAKVTNPASKGERRVRDLFRTEIGTKLMEWGVLNIVEIGREKFLKLNPPNALQCSRGILAASRS